MQAERPDRNLVRHGDDRRAPAPSGRDPHSPLQPSGTSERRAGHRFPQAGARVPKNARGGGACPESNSRRPEANVGRHVPVFHHNGRNGLRNFGMGSRCVLPKPSGRRKRRCLLLPNQLRQRVRPVTTSATTSRSTRSTAGASLTSPRPAMHTTSSIVLFRRPAWDPAPSSTARGISSTTCRAARNRSPDPTDPFIKEVTGAMSMRSKLKQYVALLETEGINLTFLDEAVQEIARFATTVNENT